MSSSAEDSTAALRPGADQPLYQPFGIRVAKSARGPVAVTEEVLHVTPFHALRQFGLAGHPGAPRVLLVPPLSGHLPVILRDLVLGLLGAGMGVTVIDWANLRHVEIGHGTFGFDDNIGTIVDAVLHVGPGTHLVALCQGGVPALAASADLAAHLPGSEPASLVLLAAPVDPLANPTPLVQLLRERPASWYRSVPLSRVPEAHAGHRRWVYAAETQLAALTRYLERELEAGTELARKMREDDGADPLRFPFRDLYGAVMDLDARIFAENIDHVFLSRDIAVGTLEFRGRRIDPAALRHTRLITVEGAEDEIAAPGQTSAAHALCTGLARREEHTLVIPGCGHFGLFHGRLCRESLCPTLAALMHT
ncbi:alpha/beta fold hydrolase (plasmid) [Salipiger sp. H15]|uniref:Alpha/beta fold hydrolase n=1 Tax=Alloyangia sp. H15 TaxID=3029062 RepID=A0AAU8ATA5_9RHOB